MMNETLKSYKSDNKGSAMITGLVVSTVLMVLCLSLLLIAYSLFLSTANSTSDLPNREMLYSAAEALEHELLDFSVQYEDDLLLTDMSDHNFWQYIDNTIWKGFELAPGTQDIYTQSVNGDYWMYYDPNDSSGYHNNLEKCSKYFNLTSIGSVKIIVQLYWELPKGFDGNAANKDSKNGTLLNAIYRMYDNKGTLLVKAEKKYLYSISQSSGTSGTNYIVLNVPTDAELYDGNHYYKYVFDNAILELNDYYQGSNAQVVIKNNNGKTTENWMFEIYFKEINNVVFNDATNYDFIRQPDGWVRISPKQTWNMTLDTNHSYYISFIYTGNVTSNPIVRQVLQENGSQNSGSSSQNTSIGCTEFIQDIGSNNYSGKVTLTNSLNKAIENWTITFNHHGNNFNVQNGNVSHHGQIVTITNLDSNGHIEPGESLDILLTFKGHGNNNELSNISAYTTESSTTPSIKTIKWTRIGEEIINPGGGN